MYTFLIQQFRLSLQTNKSYNQKYQIMSFMRRLFGRTKSSSKPTRPDSPTNKVIKKFLFYGFFLFTATTILSKKYKTKLIFTFEPNEQNVNRIETNPVFYQGIYNPVYYMFFGPMQRFYAKYFEEAPYFRASSQPATKQCFQMHQLQVHDKYSKKQNIPLLIVVTGCEGLDNGVKKIMLSMNNHGFKTVCAQTDDFHNKDRLQRTVNLIKSRNPSSKVYGIGIQYGANLLVNYAAQNQKAFDCIVSLGNPMDLQQSEKKLQNSNFLWKKLLYQDMLKGRIQACQKYKGLFGQNLKIQPQTTSLYELDRSCYSGGGYEDYAGLKERLSSVNAIKKLKVPSLFIQSQEDPFCTSIQQNQQKLQNQNCIFVESQRGGHLEWFQSMKKIRWVSKPVAQFLKHIDGRFGHAYA